jgi:energy-coupling factor transporter transmembrane protein EcfT
MVLIIGVIGVISAKNILSIVFIYALITLINLRRNILLAQLRIIFIVGLPFLLMLGLVYGIILAETPPKEYSSGWLYSLTLFARIMAITIVVQKCLLIPENQLLQTLRYWRISGAYLLIWLGANVVIEDVYKKTDKILTARYARGLVKNRSLHNRIVQLPFLLRPLIVGIFRTAIERSNSWKQKNILMIMGDMKTRPLPMPKFIEVVYLIIMSAVIVLQFTVLNVRF